MRIEQSFSVDAAVEEVWAALIDVERIAPCLPGAELTEAGDDGTYRGNFQVKLGPTTAAYRGTLKMESLDEAARVATMSANGQDKRGQGSAKATIVSTLAESGGTTTVEVVTDFTITGKLARFGRGGMIQDVSKRLLGDFAECLRQTIQAPAPGDGATAGEAGPAPGPTSETPSAGAPPAPPAQTPSQADASEAPPAPPPAAAPSSVTPAPPPAAAPSSPARGATPSDAPSAPPGAPHPHPPAAKPVRGFSLLLSILWERLKRALGRSS